MSVKSQLERWLEELITQGKISDYVQIVSQKRGDIIVKLFTDNHVYIIDATTDHLGAIAQTRKPLAGEGHVRGNDLTDGKFSRRTWDQIVLDMLSYELVPLAERVRHKKK